MKWIKKGLLVSLTTLIFCAGAYSMAEKISTSDLVTKTLYQVEMTQ